MRALAVIAALCAVGLAGCSLRPPAPALPAASPGPDPVETLVPELRLIEAAERAERALALLARTVPASDPASAMPALDSVPAALKRPVTLDWAGPLEGLVRALAARAGYRFLVAGRPRARPPIVAVEAKGEPLIAVLRDAGLRAGGAATLTVDATAETVVLDWTLVPETVSAPSATRVSTMPERDG